MVWQRRGRGVADVWKRRGRGVAEAASWHDFAVMNDGLCFSGEGTGDQQGLSLAHGHASVRASAWGFDPNGGGGAPRALCVRR